MRGILLGFAIGWLTFTEQGNSVAKKYYKELMAEAKQLYTESQKSEKKKEVKYARKDTL